MKEIVIENLRIINGGGVNVVFAAPKALLPYFKGNEFNAEYSMPVENLPYGIGVIPFVCNVLPIVWLTDAMLRLEELDEDFYNSIADFKRGYEEMYPNLQFKGKIECKRIVKHQPLCNENRSLVFFSGGVDAFATLFAHINEKPTLFSICGADIALSNKRGWANVQRQIDDVGAKFGLSTIQCYSNFREFIDEEKLCDLVASLGAKDDWWHGFQHGIGLIGHAAPLAYQYGYMTNYIASSYTIRERPYITCASDPRIDNFVQFCGAKVCHDQFEYNRQEKIHHVVDYSQSINKPIMLRVCWIAGEGENCCKCEKCKRTIFGLLAAGADPNDFGFVLSDRDIRRLVREIKWKDIIPTHILILWKDIQEDVTRSTNNDKRLRWLYWYNFERWNEWKTQYVKIKRRIRKLI